ILFQLVPCASSKSNLAYSPICGKDVQRYRSTPGGRYFLLNLPAARDRSRLLQTNSSAHRSVPCSPGLFWIDVFSSGHVGDLVLTFLACLGFFRFWVLFFHSFCCYSLR